MLSVEEAGPLTVPEPQAAPNPSTIGEHDGQHDFSMGFVVASQAGCLGPSELLKGYGFAVSAGGLVSVASSFL